MDASAASAAPGAAKAAVPAEKPAGEMAAVSRPDEGGRERIAGIDFPLKEGHFGFVDARAREAYYSS
jgi:hypothetical protein